MARNSKPWYRRDRTAWFATIDGKRHNLGRDRKSAYQQFHELMARPQKRVVNTESVAGVFDAFLDWAKQHRALRTYEWYRADVSASSKLCQTSASASFTGF
jgi:hypothetical protein